MNSFYQGLLVFTLANVMAVAGLYLLIGAAGLVSFGHAAFLAAGAYASGLVTAKLGWSFPAGLLAGMLVSVLLSVVIGFPTLRLRKEYFALGTMGVGEAIKAFLSAVQFTGGAVGLPGIPMKTSLTLMVVLTALVLWLVRNFMLSKYGRRAIALMSDELAAEATGIDTFTTKQLVFSISAALAGLAGALTAHYTAYIEPNMFSWTKSAELVAIVFLGGLRSLTGGVVATAFLTLLPEVFRFAAQWRFVLYAVAILVILIYRPGGIFGQWELSWRLFRRSERKRGAAA